MWHHQMLPFHWESKMPLGKLAIGRLTWRQSFITAKRGNLIWSAADVTQILLYCIWCTLAGHEYGRMETNETWCSAFLQHKKNVAPVGCCRGSSKRSSLGLKIQRLKWQFLKKICDGKPVLAPTLKLSSSLSWWHLNRSLLGDSRCCKLHLNCY